MFVALEIIFQKKQSCHNSLLWSSPLKKKLSTRRHVSSRMNEGRLLMDWSCVRLIFQCVGMSGYLLLDIRKSTKQCAISEPPWKQVSFEICTSPHVWKDDTGERCWYESGFCRASVFMTFPQTCEENWAKSRRWVGVLEWHCCKDHGRWLSFPHFKKKEKALFYNVKKHFSVKQKKKKCVCVFFHRSKYSLNEVLAGQGQRYWT